MWAMTASCSGSWWGRGGHDEVILEPWRTTAGQCGVNIGQVGAGIGVATGSGMGSGKVVTGVAVGPPRGHGGTMVGKCVATDGVHKSNI